MKISNTLLDRKHYSYSTDITTGQRDIRRLHKVLQENGVDNQDIQELIQIIKWEEPDIDNRQLGERANDWILKVFGKVVNSVGKINPNLTAISLATFVKQYYGISD